VERLALGNNEKIRRLKVAAIRVTTVAIVLLMMLQSSVQTDIRTGQVRVSYSVLGIPLVSSSRESIKWISEISSNSDPLWVLESDRLAIIGGKGRSTKYDGLHEMLNLVGETETLSNATRERRVQLHEAIQVFVRNNKALFFTQEDSKLILVVDDNKKYVLWDDVDSILRDENVANIVP
jgi:hypothetical protein